MTLRPLLPALLALLCLVSPAVAQEDGGAPPSAAQMEAVRDLLEATELREQMVENRRVMTETLVAQNPTVAENLDLFDELWDEMLAWDTMEPMIVEMYTDLFTVEELRGLAAFYRSDLGRKALAVQPEMTRRLVTMQQRQMQELMPRFIARLMGRQAGGADGKSKSR